VRSTLNFLGIAVVAIFSLSGCVTGGGGGGGWPLQSYPYACHTGMLPNEPVCLGSANYDNGFKYGSQFQACRTDMQSFRNAMNEHYRCASSELKGMFDKLVKQAPKTYNCYVGYFIDKEKGDPSTQCPPIDVSRFNGSYVVDGLEYDLGVPRCVRKNKGYNFAPNRKYKLDDCKKQVEIFTGKKSYGYSLNAKSAQNQYDTYMSNLRTEIDRKVDDAVRKFNCFARGDRFCY
jgi:hypothetical protein